jgi:release factor glutamine methyltransferase
METISGDRLWQWRQWAVQLASRNNISASEVDWLLRHYVQELDALALRLETYRGASSLQSQCSLDALTQLWERRVSDRTPVQHLTGMTPWRRFLLHVSPAVLIPRPETELLIDLAIDATRHHPELNSGDWVDMGTGSGAIALGLADVLPAAAIHAVDLSAAALAIARKNAEQYGMGDRIQFYQGSWFETIPHLQGRLSGMVSNPPYIPSHEITELQPEVMRHEPHLALDGGFDGLESVRRLADAAPRYLKPGGLWLVEIMAGQAKTVASMLQHGSFDDIQVHRDIEGIERFVMAYRT